MHAQYTLINGMPLSTLEINRTINPTDQMHQGNEAHYFAVGQSAIWAIDIALRSRQTQVDAKLPVRNILDFGCGCGRVGRYIRAFFPTSKLYAKDLRQSDVIWYADTFAATIFEENVTRVKFDLIWLGSVFTHLSQDASSIIMQTLHNYLCDNGVLVFTTQGRAAYERLKALDWDAATDRPHLRYGLDRSAIEQLVSDYEIYNYSYVNYPYVTTYGISIGSAQYYQKLAYSSGSLTQILFIERGFDDHQDVHAFLKRDVSNPYSSPFFSSANNT